MFHFTFGTSLNLSLVHIHAIEKRYVCEVQLISGCLSLPEKRKIQTVKTNSSYAEASLSLANLIGQFEKRK